MQELGNGEPLTYDVINKIIKDVNSLRTTLRNVQSGQKINVIGKYTYQAGRNQTFTLTGKDNISILVGTSRIPVEGKTEISKKIEFDGGVTFANPPLVVVTVADFRASTEDEFRNVYAVATIKSVGKASFDCRLEAIKVGENNNYISVNYVAIGEAKV